MLYSVPYFTDSPETMESPGSMTMEHQYEAPYIARPAPAFNWMRGHAVRPDMNQDNPATRPQFQSMAVNWPTGSFGYINHAAAIGLPVPAIHGDGHLRYPFELYVYRGARWSILVIQPHWDDEELLRQLQKKYDDMRTVWRKLFSLKGLKTIIPVPTRSAPYDVYPQQITGDPSVAKGLRFRHYLRKRHLFRGHHALVQALTASQDRGIQFAEQWQVYRIAAFVISAVAATFTTAVLYAHFTGDISTAFTIGGYMSGALSVICILVGILNLVEFK
ncbi:hypothetical protein A0H81_05803 [Grifola frondosa]|uniref:Transmembrane protein n=1 Tax=Grifola frondosa TaxID=5627 RepID=A0A1C7MC12_GRIFR|nr:hypothetical protein A0H81_05803 [Grifola frondosa]